MSLVRSTWHPTDRQLREFAIGLAVVLPAVAWLAGAQTNTIIPIAAVGVVLGVGGTLRPVAVRPVFLVAITVAAPLGVVLGEAALLIVYALVFFPVGILLRLTGHDPLARRLRRSGTSYWATYRRVRSSSSYYRQS